MLASIDTKQPKLTKEEYKPLHDALVDRLVVLQQEAKKAGTGLVVLFEGWKGAGKGSRISDLIYHLDARGVSVHVTEDFDPEEAKRTRADDFGATSYYPTMQQFWKALGPRDAITIFDRGWYSALIDHVSNEMHTTPDKKRKRVKQRTRETVEVAIEEINAFERQLVDDGYMVVKFFLHITEKTQRRRLIKLHNDPATTWRVSDHDLRQMLDYPETYKLYEKLLEATNLEKAHWTLLNAEDKRRVNLAVAETLVDVLETVTTKEKDSATVEAEAKAKENSSLQGEEKPYFDERKRSPEENHQLLQEAQERVRVAQLETPLTSRFKIVKDYPRLEDVNHTLSLDRTDYKRQLKEQQQLLNELELQMYIHRIPMMIMYEGWDAAGKGGSIKRVAQALDARSYTIFTSPAPTKAELSHPFLWRYWTRLPKAGHVGIYDRSWYGRVLVERIEGFASPLQWARAYDEINEFEESMVKWGAILLKFWVDISPETQLERFEARENNPDKRWKITAEDWRNRDRYPEYYAAVQDMFRLTSTPHAPWIILESDDKYYARVKALKTINHALQERLSEF